MGPDSAQPRVGDARLIDGPGGSLPAAPAAWRAVAASVRGRSHEQRDQPCQDAGAITVTGGGVVIAVVADGAGSATRAEEGSALAVETALGVLERAVADGSLDPVALQAAMSAAFSAARDALGDHAAAEQAPIAAFHTTLLCAVVTDDAVTLGHIGDGLAVIEDELGELQTIVLPEHGEYANSTYFLTQLPQLSERLHIRSLDRTVRSIALTTDGLLEVAFSDSFGACAPWGAFFSPLFERIRRESPTVDLRPKLAGLLGSAKIRNQTSDDVTLVIAVRDHPFDADPAGAPESTDSEPGEAEDARAEPTALADQPESPDHEDRLTVKDDVSASP